MKINDICMLADCYYDVMRPIVHLKSWVVTKRLLGMKLSYLRFTFFLIHSGIVCVSYSDDLFTFFISLSKFLFMQKYDLNDHDESSVTSLVYFVPMITPLWQGTTLQLNENLNFLRPVRMPPA